MKFTRLFLSGLIFEMLLSAGSLADTTLSIIETTSTHFNLNWNGRLGTTYFIEYSSDLKTWHYMPVVKSGAGEIQQHDFSSLKRKLYMRLRYTDAPTSDPQQADFDGDSISNWDEIRNGGLGTDPFVSDSDGDGILDAAEDRDGDGTSDAFELAAGTDFNDASEGGRNDANIDSDKDGLRNAVDAVHDDQEINWKKTSESSYVWLEIAELSPVSMNGGNQVLNGDHGYPVAANKHAQVLFSVDMWNGGTSDWIGLHRSGSLPVTFTPGGVKPSYSLNFTQELRKCVDINDNGDILGLSSEFPDGLVYSAGMTWQRTGASYAQYDSPSYFLRTTDIQYQEDGVWVLGGLANDGTIQCGSMDNLNTFSVGATSHIMAVYKEPQGGDVYIPAEPLNNNCGIAWKYNTGNYQLLLREGAELTTVGEPILEQSSEVAHSTISRIPLTNNLDGTQQGERLWIAAGGNLYLEKRTGTPTARWHHPPSINKPLKRLNERGEGITNTELWRNGRYFSLTQILQKAAGTTQIENLKAIDLASNGTILIQVEMAGILKAGILLPVDIVPDYNRDGVINTDDRGMVTEENPWRWWVNDDKDNGFMGGGGIDVPGQLNSNGQDNHINGMSDLVDFFPLYLDLEDVLKAMPKESYQYKLKQADGALKVATNLELIPDGDPNVDGAGAFWRSTSRGEGNAALSVETISSSGIVLADTVLDALKDGRGILLVECIQATEKPLILEIWKGSEKKASLEFPLKVDGVEKMFRHVNLCGAVGSTISVASRTGEPSNYPDSLTNDKAYAYIHGYNPKDSVSGNQNYQRGFHAKGFKKLHQLGSLAKFIAVTWDGATGSDYHQAAYHAFKTSAVMKGSFGFLDQKTKLIVAGHSLGNVLVSNAIAHEEFRPEKYFLINAASPVESYDSNQLTVSEAGVTTVMHPNMTEKTWDDYDNRFQSARWHEVFPPSDHRHDLKWKGRFDDVVNFTEAYNFYSRGEEVVANPEPDSRNVNVFRTVWEGVVQNKTLGRYAWVTQEFLKGGTSVAGIVFERNHGGWLLIPSSGNSPVYRFMGQGDSSLPVGHKNRYLPVTANTALENGTITNEHLAQFGYFWRFESAYEALYAPINDVNRVWQEIPGDSDFDWTNPYTQAQGSAKAGESETQWVILATGMPSISFAAAANDVDSMDGSNMMELKNGWPDFSERHVLYKNDWQHSDYWLIAPTYVRKMYEKQILEGGLKE